MHDGKFIMRNLFHLNYQLSHPVFSCRVTKEVDANSKEAKAELTKKDEGDKSTPKPVFPG